MKVTMFQCITRWINDMGRQKNILPDVAYLHLMITFKVEKINGVYEYAETSDFETIYQEIRQKEEPDLSTEYIQWNYNEWIKRYFKKQVRIYRNGHRVQDYDIELLYTIDCFLKWIDIRNKLNMD